MKTTTKTQKTVQVLAVYKFKHVARICFTVKSSQSDTTYHTCFQGNGRESCDCPAGLGNHKCYHVNQLRERAQAYFQSKQQQVSTPAARPVATYIQAGQVHTVECVEGRLVDNVSATDEAHRVSCVHGLVTRWYPEYRQGAEWFRYPQPDGNQAVSFVIEGRAEQWLAERVASVAEQAAEAKMDAFKAGLDEQYASDPRRGLSQGEMEAARSNMVHLYDEY